MIFRPLILGLLILLQGIGGKGGAGGGGGFGGLKGIPVPTLRCSSSAGTGSGTPSTLAIPICAAAQAGDFTLFFCDAAFNISAVGGWTTIILHNGTSWNSYIASKALSSGDITAGSITCTAAGGEDIVGAMATFIGATSGVREDQTTGFTATYPATLTSSSAVLSTDVGIYWNSGRTSGLDTPTITPGSGTVATLQSITTTHDGSMSLLVTQFPAGGVQSNIYSFMGLGANFDATQIFVTP